MSNKEQLQTNNNNLTSLVDSFRTEFGSQSTKLAELKTILEGKVWGGSGSTVNTCTVILECPSGDVSYGFATTILDDRVQLSSIAGASRIENVVCGTLIYVQVSDDFMMPGLSSDGTAELVIACLGNLYVFKSPTVPGEECTVVFYEAD